MKASKWKQSDLSNIDNLSEIQWFKMFENAPGMNDEDKLQLHEDSKGLPTIGYGFLLDAWLKSNAAARFDRVCGKGSYKKVFTDDQFYISQKQATDLLKLELEDFWKQAIHADPVIQELLLDIVY